jgi:hypothetical protein
MVCEGAQGLGVARHNEPEVRPAELLCAAEEVHGGDVLFVCCVRLWCNLLLFVSLVLRHRALLCAGSVWESGVLLACIWRGGGLRDPPFAAAPAPFV